MAARKTWRPRPWWILSKPAFRLGVAELKVQDRRSSYGGGAGRQGQLPGAVTRPRSPSSATLPDGKPAAHAEVAVAAVDKALLELSPNPTGTCAPPCGSAAAGRWSTSTAQMEVVGRRHYGRKAAPPGGGGGMAPPRANCLTRCCCGSPRAAGCARPGRGRGAAQRCPDQLHRSSRWPSDGVQRFGTGSTDIRTTQDLQVISGLPPVVREGDQFRAMVTVRNTTAATHAGTAATHRPIAWSCRQNRGDRGAAGARGGWKRDVPTALAQAAESAWDGRWRGAIPRPAPSDALACTLRLLPAVPLAVQQATLVQIDGHWQQPWNGPSTPCPAGAACAWPSATSWPTARACPGCVTGGQAYPVCLPGADRAARPSA